MALAAVLLTPRARFYDITCFFYPAQFTGLSHAGKNLNTHPTHA